MDGNWFYLLIPMAAALAASLALTPVMRRVAWRLGVLAHPDAQRRFHPGPVPLWGGVAVYLALLVGLAAALLSDRFRPADLARLCWALVPAATLACVFGAVDDCCNLRSRAKLLFQFLAALPITAAGFSVDFIVVFGCRIELGWWGIPLTLFWLIGCINALNLIDGLDGLASVVGLSTTMMMGIIAMNMGNDHVAVVAMVLTAALLGFLVFNRPPASIFLGDSGSTVIGLVIGVLGIQGTLKSTATLSITAPVVLMTVPMFDVLMAVLRRKLAGRPLAVGDREHIHHCLLQRGLGPWQVLAILAAFCLTTGAAATAATIFRMDALAWIIAATLVVLMIRLRVFGHREFSLLHQVVRRQAAQFVESLFYRQGRATHPGESPARVTRFVSKLIHSFTLAIFRQKPPPASTIDSRQAAPTETTETAETSKTKSTEAVLHLKDASVESSPAVQRKAA
jgi:UDP-GlcNAc:undecaprenyl-phosphate GlcNAc-1-phosphate transferase